MSIDKIIKDIFESKRSFIINDEKKSGQYI
jgi:hypothetical protein